MIMFFLNIVYNNKKIEIGNNARELSASGLFRRDGSYRRETETEHRSGERTTLLRTNLSKTTSDESATQCMQIERDTCSIEVPRQEVDSC